MFGNFRHERHVLESSEAGNEIVELKDETHMLPPETGEARIVRLEQPMIAKAHVSGGGNIETSQDIEEGRFAASRRPQENNKFPDSQIELHGTKSFDTKVPGLVGLRDGTDVEYDLGLASALAVQCCSDAAPQSGHSTRAFILAQTRFRISDANHVGGG